MNIPQMLQRLRTDNVSGATTLVELALDILKAFAAQESSQKPHEFVTALETLVDAILGDFRERFYCDRVSLPNAPQDMGNPHSVGRSYCGHARLDTGIP
jgi:translation initiation factor 2B subunit (eIF-2B alpha/beta/delta family)